MSTPRCPRFRRPLFALFLGAFLLGVLPARATAGARSAHLGPIAHVFAPEWAPFTEYTQALLTAVQVQWERIVADAKLAPAKAGTVTVRFVLNRQGNLARVVGVTGLDDEPARAACFSAIAARAPYGEWTEAMVAALGEEQELALTFTYR